jgi:hypothetical protein
VETVVFDKGKDVSLAIYPNPVVDELNVTWKKAQSVDIVIYDMSGSVVKSIGNREGKYYKIDVSGLNMGNYVLTLTGDNGETGSSIFTKQ